MHNIFVPSIDSHPVTLIERKLGLQGTALVVPFENVPKTREKYCFENVQAMVQECGGEIVYGWVVWQHGEFFVEAEHHGVWQKPSGQLVCITPQTPPEKALTFIPDPSTVYDFKNRILTKNIRIALIDDSRLEEAFRLLDQQTDLFNAGRRHDPNSLGLVGEDARTFLRLDVQKAALMSHVMSEEASSTTPHDSRTKVGRNDLCPCGSGKKFKKCHGA